jgi:biopolymer transport protein ExbB
MTRTRLLLVLLLGFLGGAWGQDARAWWNNDWAFRKEIKFDLSKSGADITGSPANVPVLIRLSLANFGYFGDTAPDGADVRFIASDDKTPLKYHVERYDPQAQIAFLWVQVPRLSGGANTDKVFLYYGNKKAQQAGDPGGTYDVNQALVYHFGAAAGSPQDSTSYKTEPSAFKATVNSASLIGSGAQFKGAETITVPATNVLHLAPAQGITVSAWVRIEAAQQQAYIAELKDAGKSLVLGINGTQAVASLSAGSAPAVVTQVTGLTTGEWHHLAVRAGNGELTLMVDGVEAGSAKTALPDIGGTLTIGGSAQGANFLTGELDELQVSNTARPNEWIAAAARSQGMVAPLVVYGGDAQKDSGGGESYFATTLRNVTIDGWVIIGILGVLFFASAGIMLGKLIYLSRVVNGNTKFLAEFRKLGDDPAALERREGKKETDEAGAAFETGSESQLMAALTSSEGAFGISTLWRLYHHGMRETMKRLEGQPAGAARVRSLSAQSIEAIRATMDASLTRMTQRLNTQMVWLTISIAGGPFLGLLGTVVGVMITFAAIAASGDVNINAIAPGTAAALVATVAGLGVAIPCLFGYNYLNTRIKEIVADMRVFVDEFVTRIAETYS